MKELTLADRKGIFASLIPYINNGSIRHGSFVIVGDQLGVGARKVSAVWHSVLARMEETVDNHDEEGAERFLRMMEGSLPLNEYPDHIFQSGKVGVVGRKRKYDRQALVEATKEIPLNERCSYRSLASGLNVSLGHAFAMVNTMNLLTRAASIVKPLLTMEQRHHRLEFVMGQIDYDGDNDEEVLRTRNGWIHSDLKYKDLFDTAFIDEKWFEKIPDKTHYFIAPGEEVPYRTTRHKKHKEKVMFWNAVTRPRYDYHRKKDWDGKVLCEPIGEIVPAKRDSVNRPKGTMVWKNLPIDGAMHLKLMKKLVDAIIAKWPRRDWRNKAYVIIIQQDGAPGHTKKAFLDAFQAYLDEKVAAGEMTPGKIRLVTQPAQSPDLNVNDLALFNGWQSVVRTKKPKNSLELIKCVLKCWEECPAYKINRVFLTLQAVYNEILKDHGGNNFKIPHLGKDKWERVKKLPISSHVSEEGQDVINLLANGPEAPEEVPSEEEEEEVPAAKTSGEPLKEKEMWHNDTSDDDDEDPNSWGVAIPNDRNPKILRLTR